MDGLGREGGQADGNVFGALGTGRAVLDPFSGGRNDGLTGRNVKRSCFVSNTQAATEDESVFVEVRRLAGLDPAGRTAHVRDTDLFVTGIHPADKLFYDFGPVPGGGDSSWRWN